MKHLSTALIMTVLAATVASAGTLRVERDGTGDFIEIQDAVNAAASGDTLLIGPGRWDAMQTYSSGWTAEVIVAIRGKSLTLIGSGKGVTIIGPEVAPPFSIPGPIAIWMSYHHDLTVMDLTVTNMRNGLYFSGNNLMVERLQFLACEIGSSVFGIVSNTYRACAFDECSLYGILGSYLATNLLVQDCLFDATYSTHMTIQNIENIMIDGCEFSRALLGVQFDGGSCVGSVQNSVFSGQRITCIYATGASQMSMYGNEFYGGEYQLGIVNHARVTGSENIFNGAEGPDATLGSIYCSIGILDLHNNHIHSGDAPYAVWFQHFEHTDLIEQHLENNYWGTTSPDSVAAWVWNEDDNPALNIQTFLDPFHQQPVSNEDLSFGELKNLYR